MEKKIMSNTKQEGPFGDTGNTYVCVCFYLSSTQVKKNTKLQNVSCL